MLYGIVLIMVISKSNTVIVVLGLAFSSMAVGKNSFYLVGGRESLYRTSQVQREPLQNLSGTEGAST